MNTCTESRTHKPGSISTRMTTLYDLMEEIDERENCLRIGLSGNQSEENDQSSLVAQRVAQLFESGRIKFKNLKDIKREYADWIV
jgi:hypothetical protein